jgi:putative peptidoglycan lipid II flippase
MAKKFTSTIAGASLLITVVGLLGRGLGFIREILFANFFGLSAVYDLYLISTVLPITINTIILYLGQNYFVPNYNRVKNKSNEEAIKFVNVSFWFFNSAGLLLFTLLYLLSKQIITAYLQNSTPEVINNAAGVFRIFLITIPLTTGISILSAYLQSEFDYKSPAYSQLFLNIAVIILVLFYSASWGIFSIPIGYVCGTILQLIFLLLKSKRILNLKIFKTGFEYNLFSVISVPFIFTLIIESISQIYLIADRFLYHQVDRGGIAALNYALNIFVLPVSIISAALSTALFPKLARSFSNQSHTELESSMNNFFSINIFLFVPIVFIFFFFGDLLIKLFFQRGAFNGDDTRMTFEVLKIYSLSLIFYSSYVVLNKLLYSIEMVKQLLYITIIGCLFKIVLNFILVAHMQQAGLALSSSASYILFFILSLLLVIKKNQIKNKQLFLSELLFCLTNAIFSYAVAVIIGNVGIVQAGTLNELIELILFLIVYIINAVFMNHKGISLFSGMIKNLRAVTFSNF